MGDEPKQWWQTLPAIIGGSATLLTALTGLLVALHQLGVFNPSEKPHESPSPEAVEEPIAGSTAAKTPKKPHGRKPSVDHLSLGRATFITDQSDSVEALATYLKQKGAEVSVISTARLDELYASRPDIVIIGADTGSTWSSLSKTTLSRLFENSKVIGFGKGGATLFLQLGLKISGPKGLHGYGTRVVVQIPELLQSPLVVPEEDKVVETYYPGQGDIIGIYDDGSPMVAGFEGIARWTRAKNHWPICRQGNYLLWGFDAPTSNMTEAGKQLFVNILINHKTLPSVPLSQVRTKVDYVKSGRISERLSKGFTHQEWPFEVKQTGHISARLSWSPPETALALILGTEQRRALRRKNGPSPLAIDFDVTEEDVARSGDDWHIDVAFFGDLGVKVIDYKLDLSLPDEKGVIKAIPSAQTSPEAPQASTFSGTWVATEPMDSWLPSKLVLNQNGSQVSFAEFRLDISHSTASVTVPLRCAPKFRKPGYNYDSSGVAGTTTLRFTLQGSTLTYENESNRKLPCDGHPVGTVRHSSRYQRAHDEAPAHD